jgi:hypothetical protein
MKSPNDEALAAMAADAEPLRRLQVFTAWVGAGRKLTQTGRIMLADPAHEEHDDMLAWLGLDKGTDFDPNRFDLNHANRALRFAGATR